LVDGINVGLWKFWHENGKLSSEGEYRNGEREGLWKFWNENGELSSEGEYINGEREGLWKFPDISGSDNDGNCYDKIFKNGLFLR
jgi:antitoxin component YwqK of YwqJK toxin-antitoxin module